MDLELFSALLQNLLHLNVLYGDTPELYEKFERAFCYHSALQPMFTAKELRRLADGMREETIYGFEDELGVCLQFLRFYGKVFLLGPFVRAGFADEKVQRTLLAHRVPVSFASSIRVYYSAFPLIGANTVRQTVSAIICAFTGQSEEYAYCRLKNAGSAVSLPQPMHAESLDYSSLHRRYDAENAFLRRIETGDVENVLPALRQMNLEGMQQPRYINAIYQSPSIGLSMLRALARKAAERGGASLVEIHEITQRAAQHVLAAKSLAEQARLGDAMILELTEAVRRSRESLSGLSDPIRRVVEHIRLNYSQELTLADLSKIAHLSESYLTKAFKAEVGMTISRYIAHLRCRQAAEMLTSGRTPVQDISSYVGYSDNNYFVKVFKREYGVTPSEYRANPDPK